MRSQNQDAAAPQQAAATQPNRWPTQIRFILGNEAAERFSFYGVKAILALYITNVLLMTQDDATQIIHLFGFVNYFTPLLGAWVSDRWWGRYNTIFWVSLSYCAGHGVMALSDAFPTIQGKVICMYVGLGLIAFGAGGIKPCVSAFMGDQFSPEQKHLLQKAYAAFYWAINLGSTASFFIIPFIHKHYGYSWAFGVPGLAMALATWILWLGRKRYVRVPPSHETRTAGFFRVALFAVNNQAIRKPGQTFWDVARTKFSNDEVDAAKSVGPILSIFALAPIFWALFDQTFSTWVLQGAKMIPFIIRIPLFNFSYTIGPEEMLAANPIMVMLFLPVMTLLVYPALGRLATPLRRMSAGMFLAGFSFVVVAYMQTLLDKGVEFSVLWQCVPYVVLTIAEILFSTTGLEFAFREAAASMKSTIIAFWWLSVALGNLFVSVLTWALAGSGGESDAAISTERFLLYAAITGVVAVLFSIVAAFYRYRDASAAEGK